MKTVTPLECYALETELLSCRDALRVIMAERRAGVHDFSPGSKMSLKNAREIAKSVADRLNLAAEQIDAAYDDHGIYHLASPVQFGIKRSTAKPSAWDNFHSIKA